MVSETDARTLLTLLLVQQAAPGPLRVVTELLDSADIELAVASGGDDYVVGRKYDLDANADILASEKQEILVSRESRPRTSRSKNPARDLRLFAFICG